MPFDVKMFEVRDEGTLIPCMATLIAPTGDDSSNDDYLLRRAGYRAGYFFILLTTLVRMESHCHRGDWQTRTMYVAHEEIEDRWSQLKSGDVIDVEFLLHLRNEPVRSQRLVEQDPVPNLFTRRTDAL